jgi:hypothetical protein
LTVQSLAELVEPYRRVAHERRLASHPVLATTVPVATGLPGALPPSMAYRADAFQDTIEAIEGEGWRLDHMSSTEGNWMVLVFRAIEG